MTPASALKDGLQLVVDTAYAAIPRPRPSDAALTQAKVVAHRGAWGANCLENTLEAFESAVRAGAWGIEFDVRWTADGVPVIHHDRDARRVFADATELSTLSFAQLRKRLPLIPTLEEVVDRFGKRGVHLMIELKADERGIDSRRQSELMRRLKDLAPVRQYHFLSLNFALLKTCTFVAKEALLPVAEFNISTASRLALEEGWSGVSGQYVLVTGAMIARHREKKQKVGTGFIGSRSALYRELNRGVDWIFTNHAIRLGEILGTAARTEG